MTTATIPREFIWKRLHSLMGLWLVLFLIEHLLTNSQAALWIEEDGSGFIRMVNALHNLPYLHAIELFLLGVPILIHLVWGVKYALTAKGNYRKRSGDKPTLKYGRNRAYSWQRITSWILLVGLIFHIAKFRFIEYPKSISQESYKGFFVKLNMDDGLYALAYRLNVQIFDQAALEKQEQEFSQREDEKSLHEVSSYMKNETRDWKEGIKPTSFDPQKEMIIQSAEKYHLSERRMNLLREFHLEKNQVIAESTNFGTATLLSVRDVFKSPLYIGIYTIFVLAACFHAGNGFWTFLLTWGLVIRRASQRSLLTVAISLIAILSLLGLSTVWCSFWLNLK